MENEPPLTPAELYERYYGPGIFEPLAMQLTEFVRPEPGERVLDLACGTGIVARRVAPMVGRQGRVVAVDINPAMLEVARRQPAPEGASIEWVEGDAVEIDLPGEAFDLILCQQGFQFFSDRPGALRRLRSLLAPGGRIGLAVWEGIDRQTLFADFAEVEARHLEPLGVPYEDLVAPFSLGDPAELGSLLESAGFSGVEVVSRPFVARFTSPESFARKMETAYGAVIPAFVENPAAFEAYVDAVERETRELVERYTVDGMVAAPMPTNLALAYAR